MRHSVFMAILILLFSTAVQAETMYVSDLAEITLRTGQGVDHKITAMVKSGQQVEVLEPDDQWTKIRLPSGKEGWVVSRFLTTKRPSSLELKELREKYQALLANADFPLKEVTTLQEENQKLHSELSVSQKALGELKKTYENLKKESSELLTLQSTYQSHVAQLSECKEKTAGLEEKLSKFESRQYVRWFLSGAAVLFVGFLMGFSAKRQRRRSSLL